MDERSNWFFRVGGRVVEAEIGVTPEEALPLLRANAFRKIANGLPLTADERDALAKTKGQPFAGTPARELTPDCSMGFAFHEAGDLIRQLDSLAANLASRLGLGAASEERAWWILSAYTERAFQNVREEAAAFSFGDGCDPTEMKLAPDAVPLEDYTTGKLLPGTEAARAAWLASPEGIASSTPDDGPLGWSMVAPANSAHELHPDKLPPPKSDADGWGDTLHDMPRDLP